MRRMAKAVRRAASARSGGADSEAVARHGIAFAGRSPPAVVSGFLSIGDEIEAAHAALIAPRCPPDRRIRSARLLVEGLVPHHGGGGRLGVDDRGLIGIDERLRDLDLLDHLHLGGSDLRPDEGSEEMVHGW